MANIAGKIREQQEQRRKEITRSAILMLKKLGGRWEDLAWEFKEEYGEEVFEE